MSEDIGGFGTRESNNIWFKYKAMRQVKDEATGKVRKEPYAKLVQWVKGEGAEKGHEVAHGFVSGILKSVQYRLNPANPDEGINPFNELILSLGAVRDGEAWTYKIPLKASSSGGFGICRRLPNLTMGELVTVASKVIDGNPVIWISRVVNGQAVKVEAVDTGISFASTENLVGSELDMIRNANALQREKWVGMTVKNLPYFDDGSQPTPVQTETVAAATGDKDYDPFSDE